MQPLKPFKNVGHISKKQTPAMLKVRSTTLTGYETNIESLSDFLEKIPSYCNDNCGMMLMSLLIKHAGAGTFECIPLEAALDSVLPLTECKSDAEYEDQIERRKDAMRDMMRTIIQQESVAEYIYCNDAYYVNSKTGEIGEAIALIHSDSATSERGMFLPYTYTEREGFIFGETVVGDIPAGRFSRLREEKS